MSTQGSSGGFNFDTQAGIAHVLASVRSADITPEQKNDLRDTIFLYTNGGRDQTVKLALEQKLVTYGVAAGPVPTGTAPNQAAPATPASPIGQGRSAPVDFSVSAPPTPVAASAPTPTPPAQPAPAPTPEPQPAPAPVAPAPTQPAPTPAPKLQPVPQSPAPAPVAPPATPTPSAQPAQPAPAPTPEPQPAPQNSEMYLTRIREIKAIVNEKVGNPVNLVDIDNEIGREYMGALLDAMKKINSGASAVSAMQRLEAALVSVEKAIAAHEAGNGQSPAPVAPAPVQSAPKPQPTPPAQPVVPPTPQPAPTPVAPAPTQPAPAPAPTPQPTPQSPAPAPVAPPATSPASPAQPKPQPATTPAPTPVTPPPAKPKPQQAQTPVPKAEPPVTAPEKSSRVPIQEVPTPAPKTDTDEARWANNSVPKSDAEKDSASTPPPAPKPASNVSSLAEKLSANDAAQPKESANTSETKPNAGDPLYTPEIDNGLDQLLSEWSLFKKSGLFGSGPKGREHPLFKKVAGLQIPLLLAGRFEGATQEIKQSITDYMNGWRYEQGIVYTQGETFERYLRRVIKHILDLQKKKTPA